MGDLGSRQFNVQRQTLAILSRPVAIVSGQRQRRCRLSIASTATSALRLWAPVMQACITNAPTLGLPRWTNTPTPTPIHPPTDPHPPTRHTPTDTHVHMHAHARTHERTHHTDTHTYACTHARRRTRTRTYAPHSHAHAHTHGTGICTARRHTDAHTDAHIHIHAHVNTYAPRCEPTSAVPCLPPSHDGFPAPGQRGATQTMRPVKHCEAWRQTFCGAGGAAVNGSGVAVSRRFRTRTERRRKRLPRSLLSSVGGCVSLSM